jgi:hypothetical protein
LYAKTTTFVFYQTGLKEAVIWQKNQRPDISTGGNISTKVKAPGHYLKRI